MKGEKKKKKRLGKVQLRILYKFYLPKNKGGINNTNTRIIKQYGGNSIYPALRSLQKHGYVRSGFYEGRKGEFYGEVYSITSEGRKVFVKNMEGKSYLEIKETLYHKNIRKPKVFWKLKKGHIL